MAALAKLPPERRQVFIDAAIDGKSYQQVADEQGVNRHGDEPPEPCAHPVETRTVIVRAGAWIRRRPQATAKFTVRELQIPGERS